MYVTHALVRNTHPHNALQFSRLDMLRCVLPSGIIGLVVEGPHDGTSVWAYIADVPYMVSTVAQVLIMALTWL